VHHLFLQPWRHGLLFAKADDASTAAEGFMAVPVSLCCFRFHCAVTAMKGCPVSRDFDGMWVTITVSSPSPVGIMVVIDLPYAATFPP